MTEDYSQMIRERPVTVAQEGGDRGRWNTPRAMTENQALYARLGYLELGRRTQHGFARVFMRKAL